MAIRGGGGGRRRRWPNRRIVVSMMATSNLLFALMCISTTTMIVSVHGSSYPPPPQLFIRGHGIGSEIRRGLQEEEPTMMGATTTLNPNDQIVQRSLQQQRNNDDGNDRSDSSGKGSSSSSTTKMKSSLSLEGKLWFALLVFSIVSFDLSIMLGLNASIWRPKWEERFSKYVAAVSVGDDDKGRSSTNGNKDEESKDTNGDTNDDNRNNGHGRNNRHTHSHSTQIDYVDNVNVRKIYGFCRMVEPIKKSVLCMGCVTFDDRNIGDTRTNNNNHKLKQIVEYKFLMRYKYAGQTFEKFMKLSSPTHDNFVPRANHTTELYVLSKNPELALLKKHVHSELQQFNYDGMKYKMWYKVFGMLGGTFGYMWSGLFFLLGCISPTLPLAFWSNTDIGFYNGGVENDNSHQSWASYILIVLVANFVIMGILNSNIQNRMNGYPVEFFKYVGHGKMLSSRQRANHYQFNNHLQHPVNGRSSGMNYNDYVANKNNGGGGGSRYGTNIDIFSTSMISNACSSISSNSGGGGGGRDRRDSTSDQSGSSPIFLTPRPFQSINNGGGGGSTSHLRVLMTGTVTSVGRISTGSSRGSRGGGGHSPSISGNSSVGSSIRTLTEIREEEDDEFEIVANPRNFEI